MRINPIHWVIAVSGFYMLSPVLADQTVKLDSPPPGPYISKKLADKIIKEQIFFNNQPPTRINKKPAHLDQYPDIIGVDKEKPKIEQEQLIQQYPELEKQIKEKPKTRKVVEYEKVKDSDSLYLFPKMEQKPKQNKKREKKEIEAIFHPLETKKKALPELQKAQQEHIPVTSDTYQNFWDIQPEEEIKHDNLNQYPPMTE